MKMDSKVRLVNGVVSALLFCFFIFHGGFGTASMHGLVGNALAWLSWAGAVLAGAHVVLCIATSKFMLQDTVRPPSNKKKRHLVLKWVTGALVACLLIAHILCTSMAGALMPSQNPIGVLVTILLITAVAAHLCIGSKSLLKDLGAQRSLRTPLRVAVIAIAVVYGLLSLASLFVG